MRFTQDNLSALVIVSDTALKKDVSGQKPFMLLMTFMVNNAFVLCNNTGCEAMLLVRPTTAIHGSVGDWYSTTHSQSNIGDENLILNHEEHEGHEQKQKTKVRKHLERKSGEGDTPWLRVRGNQNMFCLICLTIWLLTLFDPILFFNQCYKNSTNRHVTSHMLDMNVSCLNIRLIRQVNINENRKQKWENVYIWFVKVADS